MEEDMEVTEQEERGVVDSDVEGFSIALADLDPVQVNDLLGDEPIVDTSVTTQKTYPTINAIQLMDGVCHLNACILILYSWMTILNYFGNNIPINGSMSGCHREDHPRHRCPSGPFDILGLANDPYQTAILKRRTTSCKTTILQQKNDFSKSMVLIWHVVFSGNLPILRFLLDHGDDLHEEGSLEGHDRFTVLHITTEKDIM
ncbi:hypothetical protein ZEAMMB73_Zm00001d024536 [Zea mays]|uniref:Uncharacterized protein n=1 Tax=Zea mays TaxID=4577 RepID=A0A1D6J024_MAIZE|nr:hypothetical protein ZEAMMB73_Zm00001d024536 [Zea mays]